jgi:hypothetical protein
MVNWFNVGASTVKKYVDMIVCGVLMDKCKYFCKYIKKIWSTFEAHHYLFLKRL